LQLSLLTEKNLVEEYFTKMNFITLKNDFGTSDFERKSARSSRSQRWLVVILISLFILAAFLPDLWPCKVVTDAYTWIEPPMARALDMNWKVTLAMRYSMGGCEDYVRSLPYVAAVKLFYQLIPYRVFCLRLLSILSACVALFFIYRLAATLFCRTVGLICLFLLATSPVFIKEMRTFGFTAFSNAVVAIVCYLLAISLNNRKGGIKIAFLAFFSFLMLSLYVNGRLAIFFPIIFFSIYLKKYWKKLVLFLLLLIIPILILDYALDDKRFDPKEFVLVHNEWLKDNKGSIGELILFRLGHNYNIACHYLSLKYRGFYDEACDDELQKPDRLINPVYVPFLFLGVIICFWNRKKSNIFLILWLFLFFIIPFASSDIGHRRISFSFAPLYLMIALGMWFCFRLLSRFFHSDKQRLKFAYFSLAFLLLLGSYNLYNYFSGVAKPNYNYSREQLKELALAIGERGKDADAIRYNRQTEQLIWGNPYFDRPFIDMKIASKLEFDGLEFDKFYRTTRRPKKIKKQIEYARREGGNILYIHTFPPLENSDSEVDDLWWHYSDIQWVKKELGDKVVVYQVPGIKEVYFVYIK
jgi:Dolichyl-phosphate-mannose-protein mannosyltransferase